MIGLKRLATDTSSKDGNPVITWDPQLSRGEADKRTYTIYGGSSLSNPSGWLPVENLSSEEREACRFFKVRVHMK